MFCANYHLDTYILTAFHMCATNCLVLPPSCWLTGCDYSRMVGMRWGERVILGSQRWVGQSQIIVANYILSLLMVGGKSISKEIMTVWCSLLPLSVWSDFPLDLTSEICHPVQASVELLRRWSVRWTVSPWLWRALLDFGFPTGATGGVGKN